jgi:hypothetical protein
MALAGYTVETSRVNHDLTVTSWIPDPGRGARWSLLAGMEAPVNCIWDDSDPVLSMDQCPHVIEIANKAYEACALAGY